MMSASVSSVQTIWLALTLVIHKRSSQNYDKIISETSGFKIIKHGLVLLNRKLLVLFNNY